MPAAAADRPDMLAAALGYAAAGWPVHPVDPGSKQPLLGKLRDSAGEEIDGTGGVHRATTDEAAIREWWQQWPAAMVGVATGPAIGAFVVDLDAGVDEKTGEIFEAGQLLANLEAELGVVLPPTWTVETPRGGRHLYFAWPEGGRVRNRAGIIERVDVRGDGGYVNVPPSQRPDGVGYRWMRDRATVLAPAPAELVDLVVRSGRWARGAGSEASAPRRGVDEALRKYGLSALDREVRALAAAPEGTRNQAVNDAAFALGQLVGAGALSEPIARASLRDVVAAWPNRRKSEGTIASGLKAGIATPRDLSGIGVRAGERRGARVEPPPPAERPDLQVIAGGARTKGAGGRARPRLRKIAPSDQLELRDVLRAQRRRFDPPPLQARNGVRPGMWSEDELGLPVEDACPVLPLGIEGRHYHFLDSAGQYAAIAGSTMNHAAIQDLFAAAPNWPEWAFPRYGKAREVKNDDGSTSQIIPIESFKDDAVRKTLFRACERKGLFSPEHKMRGRGSWKLRDGAIYYHAGEDIWIVEGQALRALEPGIVYDGDAELVFPRMASLPAPWPKPVTAADNPARELLEGLKSWNWERPAVDPVLLLGWVGVAFLGGALDWRSAVFLIGDKGTGKSTLQSALKDIFGDALLDSANTTAAGIYQALSHDARPVAVDEIEAGSDNRKVAAVIELARQASSGAFGRRGASDARAQGVEFQMRSAFLFSAINNPPLAPQDLSRIAVLRLRPLDPANSGPLPAIDVDTCGRKILARLMLEWHRFPATLKAYREALAAGGHSGRGQDTYGTLLAAADLIVGAELADELGLAMADDLSTWSTLLHVDTLPEVGDALPNWRACINHLMQSRVDIWRSGARNTVGQLIEDLRKNDKDLLTVAQAKRQLADAGLGLARTRQHDWLIAIPNNSPLVEKLFVGSRWQGVAGIGAWSEALRQAPHDVAIRELDNRIYINSVQQRCVLIALAALGLPPTGTPPGEGFTDDVTGTVPP